MPDEPETPPAVSTTPPSESGAKDRLTGAPVVQRATDALMRFEMPERLLLIGTGLAFLLGFFKWYSIASVFGGMSVNGYAGAGWLFGIASVAIICLLLVPTLQKAVLGGATPKNASLILFGLATAAFAFGPVRFLFSGGVSGGVEMSSEMKDAFEAGKTMWFWLAFLSSGTAVAGAFLALRKHIT